MDYNMSLIKGNLARDPEMHPLGGDRYVTKFTVVSSYSYRGADERMVHEPMPIVVEAFGRLGQACSESLRKGSPVLVESRLRYYSWTEQSGQKRARHVLAATKVIFLESGRSQEEDSPGNHGVAGEIAPPPLPASAAGSGDEPPF